MREEARALRAGAADDAPSVYFVSLMPRAEFATEAAMAALTLTRVPTPTLTLILTTSNQGAPEAFQFHRTSFVPRVPSSCLYPHSDHRAT